MNFPLTKTEYKAVKAIRKRVKQNPTVFISEQEYQQWQDVLTLMKNRRLITLLDHFVFLKDEQGMPIAGQKVGKICCLRGNFAIFDNWILEQDKNAKSSSKREWTIAIVVLLVGAIINHWSFIIQWLKSIF